MTAQESDAARLGRIGAFKSWGQTADFAARTAPARRALLKKFEDQADPDGIMSPKARAKRAEFLRRAYFRELAEKSANVRKHRAAGGEDRTPP